MIGFVFTTIVAYTQAQTSLSSCSLTQNGPLPRKKRHLNNVLSHNGLFRKLGPKLNMLDLILVKNFCESILMVTAIAIVSG
jgi:hypothetical protein